ncbi:MAG: exodeoxyribonuclease VII small subunit [Bacteroidetes Order II. Incertae sedis bacterium]|nr:exodeoxyribonuclease VII small subunit [Bacteroidetes Order II. bacterium]
MSQLLSERTFSEAIQSLEQIVRTLEQPVPLEEALSLYEEGLSLAHFCETRLQEAQLRIEKLSLQPSEVHSSTL